MTKCIVKTTGNFMVSNAMYEPVQPHRASVTTFTGTLENLEENGKLVFLARNLPIEVTDEDFEKLLKTEGMTEEKAVAKIAGGVEGDKEAEEAKAKADEAEAEAAEAAKLKEVEEAEAAKLKEAEDKETEVAKPKGKAAKKAK